ncbi:MAG: hypothetical protein U5K84_09395 [Alkalibacterium sp.]|nr:hypothetical protein [Alkalibacterium sp.]
MSRKEDRKLKKKVKDKPEQERLTEKERLLESERQLAKKLRKEEVNARKDAIKNREPFKGLQIRPTVLFLMKKEERKSGNETGKDMALIFIRRSPFQPLSS